MVLKRKAKQQVPPAEADHLFRILGQLKDQGKTVILITHKLR